jgi:dihydropteroate synthase
MMLTLAALAQLATEHAEALAHPVAPLHLGGRPHDTDAEPILMGVVNLSRDSTYRDSVAPSPAAAIRRGRIMSAQGAGIIDVGAESTTARAARVTPADQRDTLVPVIRGLVAAGITVSVEAYDPDLIGAALAAGASVLNLTGARELPRIYDLAAAHGATVVQCFVAGGDVRDLGLAPGAAGDPIPYLLDHFGQRLAQARSHGVTSIAIDPGMGFYYPNLTDPLARARHQGRVLLNSFRLRVLGAPVCQALPHAFDLFEEEFRTAEGFFAVLAALGRTGVLRTHEVSRVAAVMRAVAGLSDPPA